MQRAFDTFKELSYHDVRLSIEDLVSLIRSMLDHYTWEHHMQCLLFLVMCSYSQMLHLLYEYRRCDIAYEVILKMKEAQVRINSDDYMDAIRVCSVGKNADSIALTIWNMMLAEGYSPTLVDHEVLLNCYIRSSNMKGAEELFEAIRRKGMKPTVWTYNSLLTGYKRNGSWERALQIYQIMKLDQVQADGVTYMIILDLLWKTQKQEYMPVIVKDIQQGYDFVGSISKEINAAFPNHQMGDVNLYNSTAFLQNFDQLLQNESIELLHYQFTKLYLRKASLNALLLWFIKQDDHLAVLYLYRCTRRSKRTTPDDLTYKLLFHYCGVKQDTELFSIIMNDATTQGFTYTVGEREGSEA